jgi:hypothetical protein
VNVGAVGEGDFFVVVEYYLKDPLLQDQFTVLSYSDEN